ncbi:hypothetical protein HOLleu_00656 [Holothuria leucospilota]|uniref:Uncharacterized protein n=1 Tax=Holothuria leucospilota TaxID=206669 RepID=A0A9Q1HKH0_HOLLE|nr:hypothetical protein HOLleu_00656 [Holothuria leucospilota]
MDKSEPTLASHVLLFMARGITSSLKFPVANYATASSRGSQLQEMTYEVIAALKLMGLTVLCLVSDGSASNRRLPEHRGKGQKIQWTDLMAFMEWDQGRHRSTPGLCLAPKLTHEHLYLTPGLRMKVRLAAQWLLKDFLGFFTEWINEGENIEGLTRKERGQLCISRQTIAGIYITEASSEPQSTSLVDGMSTTPLQPECQSADVNASVSAGVSIHCNTQVAVKRKPDVGVDEIRKLVEDCHFSNPDSKLHQYHICREAGCINVSPSDTMKRDRPNKRQEYFSHSWLLDPKVAYCETTGIWWLVYQENVGMFCLLCRKHNTANLHNKAVEYNQKPAVRFRKRAVQEHAASAKHKAARQAELTSRVSVFERLYQQRENTRVSTISNAFLAAYWLAKEELPNINLYSLIGLLEKAGLEQMRYFAYRSKGIAREIFLILGEVIRDEVASKVNEANCYGILTDEVTDITTLEIMVTFIQYVSKGAEVHTDFIFADNLLAESDSANAETIVTVLKKKPKKAGHLFDRVERRLKKACTTRWLSFDHAIKSVYQDYVAVLLTLNHLADNQPKSSLQYDILCYLAEVALAAPISNAWPERGASAIKRIKTRLRSRLNMDMLDSLLHISINGPDVNSSESELVVEKAVEKFMNRKRRASGKMTCRSDCKQMTNQTAEATAATGIDADEEDAQHSAHEVIVALGLDEYSESSECESDSDLIDDVQFL